MRHLHKFQFPFLTILVRYFRLVRFQWHYPSFFETRPGFAATFCFFSGFKSVSMKLFWFQNGILGQKWVKMRFQKLSYCSTKFHKPVLTENFFVSFLHYKILKTLNTLTEIYYRSTYITSLFHPSSATKVELDFHCNGQVFIVL